MGYLSPSPPTVLRTHIVLSDRDAAILRQAWYSFHAAQPPGSSYQRYFADLYGERHRDWFPVLNYGLLGCLIALTLLIAKSITAA